MEMCYDGALVMPNNYAVVDEDEMMYVDGGYDCYREMTANELVKLADDITVYGAGACLAITVIAGLLGAKLGVQGALICGAIGAVASGVLYYSWWNNFSTVHHQASQISRANGNNQRVGVYVTWNSIGMCTGTTVYTL